MMPFSVTIWYCLSACMIDSIPARMLMWSYSHMSQLAVIFHHENSTSNFAINVLKKFAGLTALIFTSSKSEIISFRNLIHSNPLLLKCSSE